MGHEASTAHILFLENLAEGVSVWWFGGGDQQPTKVIGSQSQNTIMDVYKVRNSTMHGLGENGHPFYAFVLVVHPTSPNHIQNKLVVLTQHYSCTSYNVKTLER